MSQNTIIRSVKQPKLPLSNAFQKKRRQENSFILIIEDVESLLQILSFLSVSDIVKITMLSKDIQKILTNNTKIQNFILKAQVQFLKKQEQKMFQLNPFFQNRFNQPAYSIFQSYFENRSILNAIESKLVDPKLVILAKENFAKNNPTKTLTKIFVFLKEIKDKGKPVTIKPLINEQISVNKIEQPKYQQTVINDPYIKRIQRWQQLARKKEQERKNAQQPTPQQVTYFLYQDMLKKNIPVEIIKKTQDNQKKTLWTKLNSLFRF